MRTRVAGKEPTPGKRVGTKKRDMRWEVDGEVWDSRFEYEVYRGLSQQLGSGRVRRCTEEDQMDYQSELPRAECAKCHSHEVVQRRKFTPDLVVVPARVAGGKDKQDGYFVEAKGLVRPDRRALLRHFVKCHPHLDLRFVIQRDHVISKHSGLTLGGWITKYLKRPWIVWTGSLPDGWR